MGRGQSLSVHDVPPHDPNTTHADCIEAERRLKVERDALRADLANRHYVCEAHVPLGEPGNLDDKCPCCEAMKLADDLRACAEALRGAEAEVRAALARPGVREAMK